MTTLLGLTMGVTINGFAHDAIGRAGTQERDAASPASFATAGPVLDLSGSNVRSTAGGDTRSR